MRNFHFPALDDLLLKAETAKGNPDSWVPEVDGVLADHLTGTQADVDPRRDVPFKRVVREDGVVGHRIETTKSSNVRSVTWFPTTRQMSVVFGRPGRMTANQGHNHQTSEYMHEDVPLEAFMGLISAKSVGSYFHRNIKGRFDGRKVR